MALQGLAHFCKWYCFTQSQCTNRKTSQKVEPFPHRIVLLSTRGRQTQPHQCCQITVVNTWLQTHMTNGLDPLSRLTFSCRLRRVCVCVCLSLCQFAHGITVKQTSTLFKFSIFLSYLYVTFNVKITVTTRSFICRGWE